MGYVLEHDHGRSRLNDLWRLLSGSLDVGVVSVLVSFCLPCNDASGSDNDFKTKQIWL